METPLVVAVDCSTTAVKALVVDTTGAVLAQGVSELDTQVPQPGFHEQDALQWLDATYDAVRRAVRQVVRRLGPRGAARIGALAVTHQRESFVLIDGQGQPVRPAILWVDSRSHQEIAELGAKPVDGSRSVHDVSGKPPDTTPALYKLAWLARHEPDSLVQAAFVADVQAFVALHLTGRLVTSRASADTLGLHDAGLGQWSPSLVERAGLQMDQLPQLVDAGEVIGGLLPHVADDLQLPASVVLVATVGDGQAAGMALGVLPYGPQGHLLPAAPPSSLGWLSPPESDQADADSGCLSPSKPPHTVADAVEVAYLNLGTSMVCGLASDSYVVNPAFRTLLGAQPGTYVLETVLNAAAYLASWTASLLGSTVRQLEASAMDLPAGSEGLLVLPYWNAAQSPHWDPLARGVVVGWQGSHTQGHMYRAVLEGVAYELRGQLEALEAATGHQITVLRAVGGGAKSALWTQILADVTGRQIHVCADQQYSALGAALSAFQGVGWELSADAFAVRVSSVVLPHDGRSGQYEALYQVHQTLYPTLAATFAALAQV